MKKNKFYILTIIIGIILDLISKTYIISKASGIWMLTGETAKIVPNPILFDPPLTNFFNLTLIFNKGISFSMFYNHSTLGMYIILLITTAITLFLIHLFKKEKNRFNKFFICFAIAGAIGNAIDRFRFGAVVDFLDFHIGPYHWPSFNLADSFIVCGILLYIYNSYRLEKKKK